MEGGGRGNLLDPAAAEFYPAVAGAGGQLALTPPQVYYTYPPPPPPLQPPPPPVMAVPVFHLQQPQQMEVPAALPAMATSTRAVALSMVPRHVGEAEVRAEMEAFGGVRAVEMGALAGEGVVTVHFFDLRSAELAVAAVRDQHVRMHSRIGYGATGASGGGDNWAAPWLWHMPELGGGIRGTISGHPVWAQFAAAALDDPNQGSIVVLNCDTSVSFMALREIFEPFGAVKELREMPSRPQHKLVEFFDTRDAARALAELNGKEINGRRLLLEFRRPGSSHPRSNYPRRSSGHGHGHHNSPLPPRFLRGCPQPGSRWAQTSGASSRSSSSSSVRDRGSREASQGPAVVLNKTTADTTAAAARSGSVSGRKNKSSSSSSNHPSPASSSSSSKQHQQQSSGGGGGRRSWKNRGKSSGESRFLFKEVESEDSSESSSRDSRTTVMIKNIPNKYSQKLLLNMLDNHCIQCNEQIGEGADEQPYSAYDFVYLPIDFNNKCNVGYGFVNLTSPEAAFRLYKAFHQQPWEVFNSRKICQVTYARLQGLEALKEHFRNSKFACDNDEYMPVVFSPPRDGKQLTDPIPVVVGREQRLADLGRTSSGCTDEAASQLATDSGGASSTTTSTQAPSDNADGGDEDEDDDDDYNDDVEDDDDDSDEAGREGRGDDGGGGGGGDGTGVELTAAVLQLSCN